LRPVRSCRSRMSIAVMRPAVLLSALQRRVVVDWVCIMVASRRLTAEVARRRVRCGCYDSCSVCPPPSSFRYHRVCAISWRCRWVSGLPWLGSYVVSAAPRCRVWL